MTMVESEKIDLSNEILYVLNEIHQEFESIDESLNNMIQNKNQSKQILRRTRLVLEGGH